MYIILREAVGVELGVNSRRSKLVMIHSAAEQSIESSSVKGPILCVDHGNAFLRQAFKRREKEGLGLYMKYREQKARRKPKNFANGKIDQVNY
jgi:hypothetical protein